MLHPLTDVLGAILDAGWGVINDFTLMAGYESSFVLVDGGRSAVFDGAVFAHGIY